MRVKKFTGDYGYFKLKQNGGFELYKRKPGWKLEKVEAKIGRFCKKIKIELIDQADRKVTLRFEKRFPWRGAWYAQN